MIYPAAAMRSEAKTSQKSVTPRTIGVCPRSLVNGYNNAVGKQHLRNGNKQKVLPSD